MFAVGHLALGYLTGKTVSKLINMKISIPLLFLGSILPDIDLILGVLGLEHRGPTHSLLLYAIAFMPVFLLYGKQVIPFFVALAQHPLLGDLLTGGGVQILWPASYESVGAQLCMKGTLNISLEWATFLIAMVLLLKTRDKFSLFQHHPSNMLLTIPAIAIILPAFLGFPLVVPLALIIPHLAFLAILALSIAADLKQISKLNTRKT